MRNHADNGAEVAFIVADKYQNRGLGSHLLESMIAIARAEGISRLDGTVLSENINMKDLLMRAGFHFGPPEDGAVTALLDLSKK